MPDLRTIRKTSVISAIVHTDIWIRFHRHTKQERYPLLCNVLQILTQLLTKCSTLCGLVRFITVYQRACMSINEWSAPLHEAHSDKSNSTAERWYRGWTPMKIHHLLTYLRINWQSKAKFVSKNMLKETSIPKILNELKTNCFSSNQHYHVFYSGMTIRFNLKRTSSDHHYKNFKIRYNTVQIMLVLWDPIWLTKVTQYKIYIKLYKNCWIGNVLGLCPSCV